VDTIISRTDRDGIAILTWDDPGRRVNVKSRQAIATLAGHVEAVLADERIGGYVIASGKPDFVAGGDIEDLRRCATPADAAALLAPVRQLLRRMETGGKPAVAALRGNALGGGLELALACHARVAADLPETCLGLPEVTLGLMPGAGGTQRLPRLIGLKAAMPMILDGKPVSARQALELGLVDQVVPEERLLAAACALAGSGLAPVQRWERPAHAAEFDPQSAAGRRLFALQWPKTKARLGEADIAPEAILMALHHGLERGLEAGLAIEARHFDRLASSDAARNTIRTGFVGMNAARRIAARPAGVAVREFRRAAVIGAGLMGCGIAYSLAASGLDVLLVDRDEDRTGQGVAAIGRIAGRQLAAGRIDTTARDAILARLTPAPMQALADLDVVVEAVFEDEAAKAGVLAAASGALRPRGLVASNTSTLPISRLARHCARPADFLGLHFFAPVERIELVEVIRGGETSEATLAGALDLVKRLRKIPVVVGDGPGFFTSRVIGAYTGEALTMLAEGVDPAVVDNVALAFGMPVGPLHMADLTGIPVLTMIFASLAANEAGMAGLRADEALAALGARGRTGKAAGGIYDHGPDGVARWPGLAEAFPARQTPLPREIIRRRLAYAQSIEAVRALEEKVIAAALDGDIAARLGWRYPLAHGGVFAFVDSVGARRFVAESRELAAAFGRRFDPPATLVRLAERDERFHPL